MSSHICFDKNRYNMKPLAILLLIFLHLGCDSANDVTYKIEKFKLYSQVFDNERTIRVFLPSQHSPDQPLGVLYLNDGQNLFTADSVGSPVKWRVAQIADSLIRSGVIEPVIIVGIDHMGINRGKEYLPYPNEFDPATLDVQGKLYPRFLTEEVIPAINRRYNVLNDPAHTGLGGSSYGGIATLYAAATTTDVFGHLLVESPSLYVNNFEILRTLEQYEGSWPSKVFIGMGTNEMGAEDCGTNNQLNQMAVESAQRLDSLLRNQFDCELLVNIDDCAIHHESAWSKRLPQALPFLLN